MPFLKNLSIKNKLILAFLLVTLLPLLAGFTIVFLNELSTFKTDMTDETVVMARIIGDSSVMDLTSRDTVASERTLTKLIALPNKREAHVLQASAFPCLIGSHGF